MKHFKICLALCLGFFISKAQYVPIAVTGYDVDAVAENTTAAAFTSAGLDGGQYILFNTTYAAMFSPASTGLPNNGTIVNGLDTYQMAPYNQNNFLLLAPGIGDSIVFTNPAAYNGLSIMNFGTDGAPTMSLTIRFTDNSIQTYGNVTVQDWFNGTGAVISNFDRALRSNGIPVYASGNPRFYASNYFPSCANRVKQIRALLIKNTSTASKLVIAGVSGVAAPVFSTNISPIPCAGTTGSASVLISGGAGPYTFTWSTSPVQTSSAAINLTAGAYNYSVTDAGGCVFTSTVIMPPPTGSQLPPVIQPFTNPICSGQSQTLTAQGAASYTWTGGISNGVAFTPTTAVNPSVVNYTVSGTNACNTGSNSTVVTLTINPNPTITASSSSPSLCSGNTLALSGGGSTGTYTWSAGISNAVSFTPAATATYVVTGSNSIGCFASSSIVVPVINTPTAAPVSNPAYVCLGSSATLSAIGATNYTWLPGNTTGSSVVISPVATTIYTLTKSNSNCVDVKTISIVVYTLPTVSIVAASPTVCAGSQTTLQAISSSATNYTWAPIAFTSSNAIVTPISNSSYTVAVYNGTCFNTATVAISTVPIPTVSSTSTGSMICAGQTVTLTASGAVSYTWNPGNIVSSVAVVSPSVPMQFSVSGTNSLGCSAISSQVIIVNSAPVLTVSQSDQTICNGNSATLTVLGAANYTWSTGSNSNTVVVSPSSGSNVYTVSAAGTNSCVGSQTLQVDVFSPSVAVNSASTICRGNSATLTASGAFSYTWTGGPQNNLYQVSPSVTSIYSVAATTNSFNINCISSNTVLVTVNPLPTVTAVSSRSAICKSETVILTAAGASTYSWSTGATTSSVAITSSLVTTFNYTVIGTSSLGCASNATVSVKINACVGLDKNELNAALRIYPNPNSGEFNIEVPQIPTQVVLYNLLGDEMMRVELNAQNDYKTKITSLSKGIYLVSFNAGDMQWSKKIIVE